MPLGGSNINWDETSPANTDNLGGGDDAIRSAKTSLRNALGSEHNFPAAGGANTGYHIYGSARPFYDVESNVSSSGTDGRLLLTSNTSRLFGVGSSGTMLLGGANVPMVSAVLAFDGASVGGVFATIPQTHYWAIESGMTTVPAAGTAKVVFNSLYSGIPIVICSLIAENTPYIVSVPSGGASRATSGVSIRCQTPSGTLAGAEVAWISIGSRVLGG